MGSFPYRAKVVANAFLQIAESEGQLVTPMKLQKLIYFAHGWCLALLKEPLIDENIQAWTYGPVVSSVYYEFREFGRSSITRHALGNSPHEIFEDHITSALLNKIWDVFGKYTGLKLSMMTLLSDSPWELVKSQSIKVNAPIDDDMIKDYFSNN